MPSANTNNLPFNKDAGTELIYNKNSIGPIIMMYLELLHNL